MKLTIVEPSYEILKAPTQEDLKFIELCGRTCYKSEDRITDTSASKFVRGLRESRHESVIEHVSATVKFIGSRSFSHQLVRHRLASYSQESQRFCNCAKKGFTFICPAKIGIPEGTYQHPYPENFTAKQLYWLKCRFQECCEYMEAIESGMKPEDARECLPNATKTEIVMTCNLRTWRHVFKERCAPAAQAPIRKLMQGVLREFNATVPEIFEDLV
jgi:thymidylate synthase (FAD)